MFAQTTKKGHYAFMSCMILSWLFPLTARIPATHAHGIRRDSATATRPVFNRVRALENSRGTHLDYVAFHCVSFSVSFRCVVRVFFTSTTSSFDLETSLIATHALIYCK